MFGYQTNLYDTADSNSSSHFAAKENRWDNGKIGIQKTLFLEKLISVVPKCRNISWRTNEKPKENLRKKKKNQTSRDVLSK